MLNYQYILCLEYNVFKRQGVIMGKIVINQDKCKACYLCIDACPKGSIEKDTKLNQKGYFPVAFNEQKGCIACAICARSCPDLAIEKVYK